MLNRLPKELPDLNELLNDIGAGRLTSAEIGAALGVSSRTVRRWKKDGAPRIALLALWWLSEAGHRTWDAEMHNRTQMALAMVPSLWREVGRLRTRLAAALGPRAPALDGGATPSASAPVPPRSWRRDWRRYRA